MVVVNGEPLLYQSQKRNNYNACMRRYAWYYIQVVQLDLPLHDYYGFHAWFDHGLDFKLALSMQYLNSLQLKLHGSNNHVEADPTGPPACNTMHTYMHAI